jgi:hypothetical protein
LYIRNAIESANDKPRGRDLLWSESVNREVEKYASLVSAYHPRLILTFGQFAFEFARRAGLVADENAALVLYEGWGCKELGEAFRRSIDKFNPGQQNCIPLLHAVVARKLRQAQDDFCGDSQGNYFECAGNRIADKLLEYRDQLNIWIE